MKKTLLLAAILATVVGCTEYNNPVGQGPYMDNGSGNMRNGDGKAMHNYNILSMPKEDLSEAEISALDATLNDEYKAQATYQKVLDKFGDVRPFSNIVRSEQTHIDALVQLYEKYALNVPENVWYEKVPEFNSVQEACKAGVDAEIANAGLYDGLFSKVDNKDITTVFTSLRDASLNNHLPAFQRCGGMQ